MKYDRCIMNFIDDSVRLQCVCKPCDVCLAIGPCKHCIKSCKVIKAYIKNDALYLLEDD